MSMEYDSYGDQLGDYDMPTNPQTPNWWEDQSSPNDPKYGGGDYGQNLPGQGRPGTTLGDPSITGTLPGESGASGDSNNLIQSWLKKLGITNPGSTVDGILGGVNNQALFAGLMGLMAARDKQKPTGGGTSNRYAGAAPMHRTMTQGKYGPIAQYAAEGGMINKYAEGGIAGRFLEGPGDGVSDSIPATINGKHPAALADGEFVVPARIVSELGNGSSQAGARKLQAMVDRINKSRAASKPVAANTKAEKQLPR